LCDLTAWLSPDTTFSIKYSYLLREKLMPKEFLVEIKIYATRQQFVLFSFLVTFFFFCALQKRKK